MRHLSFGLLGLASLAAAFLACGSDATTSSTSTVASSTASSVSSSAVTSSTVASTTSSTGSGGAGGMGGGAPAGGCGPDVAAPNETLPDTTDPAHGMFTMDDALVDLPPGPGPLRAIITTDLGVLTCTFHATEAPNAVANFVGLARGQRPWKDPVAKKWVKRKFYDGLTFHRVIPMFVAQGGDPLGTGFGGPGYEFKDEIAGLTHAAGTMAYANSGPNTNGSQFYVCETPQPQLDSAYTIFGECTPVSVVTALTSVPRDANDKPLTPLHMQTVEITRCAP